MYISCKWSAYKVLKTCIFGANRICSNVILSVHYVREWHSSVSCQLYATVCVYHIFFVSVVLFLTMLTDSCRFWKTYYWLYLICIMSTLISLSLLTIKLIPWQQLGVIGYYVIVLRSCVAIFKCALFLRTLWCQSLSPL